LRAKCTERAAIAPQGTYGLAGALSALWSDGALSVALHQVFIAPQHKLRQTNQASVATLPATID
jgi:hypothetical protein